jgi:hypothetical protein
VKAYFLSGDFNYTGHQLISNYRVSGIPYISSIPVNQCMVLPISCCVNSPIQNLRSCPIYVNSCSSVADYLFILSRKDRKAREGISVGESRFALCNTFFHHEGHEEHEGFVCSKF